ncbi:MAG: hypothetical protein IPL61_12995 [Myxococcales bacterium]|nr:hypothetical protein [Myxococcales bacterium]
MVALATMLGGCRPNLSTERGRYGFLESHIYDALATKLGCTTARVSFVMTEQRNGARYDNYRAEGCGQTSDLVTHVSQEGGLVIWAISVPPSKDAFVSAAEQQMQVVARFELACEAVDVVSLNGVIDAMRTSYRATLGARGCQRQASYDVLCGDNGFVDGARDIVCTRVAGPGSSTP